MATKNSRSHPPPVKPDDAQQSRRFEETARELGIDESGKPFRKTLDEIIPKRPDPSRPEKRN
jgi:hypothetical protein